MESEPLPPEATAAALPESNKTESNKAWERVQCARHPKRPHTLDYRFKVQNNPARGTTPGGVVDASYTGLLPDTFKDEAEVVLKGKLTPTGFKTDPNGVMAKCPSKYEAAEKSALAGT